MTESAWRPDDKAWVKERKRQWSALQPRLRLLAKRTELKRSSMPAHRELFVDGTFRGEPVELPDGGNEDFLYMLPVFWLWYHPDAESLDLDAVRDGYLRAGSLRTGADTLFFEWTNIEEPPRGLLPADEGLMGGRERLVVELLCPGLDYREPWPKPSGDEDRACLRPELTLIRCLAGSIRELRIDGTHHAHAFGQFLWPHLAYAIEHYTDEIFVSDQNGSTEDKRGDVKRVVAQILGFAQREDPSRRRPSTIAFVDRVLGLEREGFGGAMAELWAEAAEQQDALRAESEELGEFDMPLERAERFGWTAEALEARKAQWKSV